MTRLIAIVAALGLAALPIVSVLSGDSHVLSIVTRAMIFAIAAISLNLILGYGGLVSFGHAAFMGIGAYSVGILSAHGVGDILIQAIVTIGACAIFAMATGLISLRTKGVHFIMITLAFGQMIFFLAVSLAAYGGDDGMTLPQRSTLFGYAVIRSSTAFYYLVLACLAGALLLSRSLVQSRFGRVIRALRENTERMQAIGFTALRYQIAAYMISGTICGISGMLIANHSEFVSPAYMTWQRSGELIVMVLLGGMGTLAGPVIGAATFVLLEEWLAGLTEHWKLIFGPLLVLVVLYARGGLIGALKHVHGRRHG